MTRVLAHRKSVNDGNPYSEAWFKTARYHAEAPPVVTSLAKLTEHLSRSG